MRRGFTLVELVIVIALIALVGSLVVVNAEAILAGLGEQPVERILQKAVREARYQAASLKEPVGLYYDGEKAALAILDSGGGELASFEITEEEAGRLDIAFEQILPGEGLDGRPSRGTAPLDAVVFRPDRSSTPFQAVIRHGRDSYTLRYDPFSAIVIDDSRKQ